MEAVYTAIAKASESYSLPPPWRELPCDPAFVCLPPDRSAFLSELRGQFTDELLIQAGVVSPGAEGNLNFIPTLAAKDQPIWAIRQRSDGEVTTLIAGMRTVGKRQWSSATVIRVDQQRGLIAAPTNPIVVAYSMPDLAILRSAGIAAVPGEAWHRLSKSQLEFLWSFSESTPAVTGSPTLSTQRGESDEGPRGLILANWSLATMDRTDVPAAMTSWSHLVELFQHLDAPFDAFSRWQPSDKSLKKLSFQLQYQDPKRVRTGLLEGIDRDSTAIEAELGASRPPPLSIIDAHRAWVKAERSTNVVARQRAFDQLCDVLERQRFEPMMEEALRTTNPLERNVQIALVETSRLLQPQMLLLSERVRRSISEKGARAGTGLTKEELDQVLALSDRQFALTRGILACRRNQPAPMTRLFRPKAARSEPSDSKPKD